MYLNIIHTSVHTIHTMYIITIKTAGLILTIIIRCLNGQMQINLNLFLNAVQFAACRPKSVGRLWLSDLVSSGLLLKSKAANRIAPYDEDLDPAVEV